MPLLISLLYGVAALFGAAFALVELRMLTRFLRNRSAIREASSSGHEERPGAAGAQDTQPPREGAVAPTVTIQIPLYNERTAAEQIILAAAAQDYPNTRFDIQVLDDSTDETTEIVASVVEAVRASGVRIAHVRRDNRKGYKAGALSEALTKTDSEFLALFDADFVPEPSFLRRLLLEAHPFDDPTVAFVQARWYWGSEIKDLLPSALALLLDRHFSIQKPTAAFVGNVMTFNGSAGIWRRTAIAEAGGWTSDTLTEDLDLSYRCALKGWHGRYVHDVRVTNELPGHMRAFKLQQRRWARGNAQCFRKLMGRVVASKGLLRNKLDETFILAGYAIHPLLLASLILWPWAVVYMNRTLFLVLQAFMSLGMIAALLSFLITVRERDHSWKLRSVGEVLFGMGVGMGLMVNNTWGQIQGFLTAGGEFLRTPKGVHRAKDRALAPLAERAYLNPLHWTFFVEILVIGYCLAGGAFLVQHGDALWSLPMFMWSLSLGLVVQQQLLTPRLA